MHDASQFRPKNAAGIHWSAGIGRRRGYAAAGYPATIRDNEGSSLVSRDFDLWAYAKGVALDFSRPGKQTDNAFLETFNGRFRAERLNAHGFLTIGRRARLP